MTDIIKTVSKGPNHNIYFTSDTHFNHGNVVSLDHRPFTDLEHMTESLIEKWNERVKHNDIVYHIGDFALSWGKKHYDLIDKILSRLNGTKFLIVGNHDRDEVTKNPRWSKVTHYHEIKVDLGGVHKQRICMMHYAIRSWNQMHRGAWMLHGHSHGNLPDIGGKILDVGTMNWGFAPVRLDEIEHVMSDRQIITEDHHS